MGAHVQDRAQFIIRAVRPDDEANLARFFRSLSILSRHRRFLSAVNELPATLLARLARPDTGHEIALVAAPLDSTDGSVVAEARFVAGDANMAEMAIAVSDAAQGHGLGAQLLRVLLRRARKTGMRAVYGDVLPDNRPMLALARKFGFSQRRSPDDARLVRVQKTLLVPQSA